MLEQLKEASKILVIPTAVLYLLGFICITGYYGQFGIVTFDIANARFLVAGIYVAMALGVATLIAWQISTTLAAAVDTGAVKDVRVRLGLYTLFVIYNWIAAFALQRIFSVGQDATHAARPRLEFTPILGLWDFVGNQLAGVSSGRNDDFIWIILCTLNVAGLLLCVWVVFELIRMVVDVIAPKRKPAAKDAQGSVVVSAVPASALETQSSSASPTDPQGRPRPLAPTSARLLVGVEILAAAILLVLLAYSYLKIRADLFDLRSISDPRPLETLLVFAWMFGTSFAIAFFLPVTNEHTRQSEFGFLKKYIDIGNFTQLAQFLILPILGSVFLFGGTVFPRIPFSLGGGEPHEVTITTKLGTWEKSVGRTYLLGESVQFLFVAAINGESGSAYAVSKDQIAHLKTRTQPPAKGSQQTSDPAAQP